MAEGQSQEDPRVQVEAARKAFEQEFERFARFAGNSPQRPHISLAEAEVEQRLLDELRTRHVGKKSAIAACRKLIATVTVCLLRRKVPWDTASSSFILRRWCQRM